MNTNKLQYAAFTNQYKEKYGEGFDESKHPRNHGEFASKGSSASSGKDKSTEWHKSAQDYLARVGESEHKQGLAAHIKKGKKAHTYKHNPSDYHRSLVELLGKNDEHGF